MRFGNGGVRPALALLAVATTLTLGACGGGAEPSSIDDGDKPNQQSTPKPKPEPEPEPEPTPDLATDLEATAKEFYTKLNEAYETYEIEPFRKMGGRGCGACYNYLDNIEMYVDKGQRIEGSTSTITEFQVTDDDKINPAATYTVTFSAARIVDDNGKLVDELEPESHKDKMVFEKVEGKWIVAEQSER